MDGLFPIPMGYFRRLCLLIPPIAITTNPFGVIHPSLSQHPLWGYEGVGLLRHILNVWKLRKIVEPIESDSIFTQEGTFLCI